MVSYFYVNALEHEKLEVLGLVLFMEDTLLLQEGVLSLIPDYSED